MPTATAGDPKIPYNLEAERALLGSILLDGESLAEIRRELLVEELYSQSHRLIYQQILSLADASRAIDTITVCEELSKRNGDLDRAGGGLYVTELTNGIPLGTTSHVAEYIHIIKEKAKARRRLRDGQELAEQIAEGASAEDIAAQAEKIIQTVRPLKEPKRADSKFPDIPRAAYHGMAAAYVLAMGRTSEASDNFHYATFLSVAGALLGKSVAVGTDEDDLLYPNVFTVIVGDSGSCKDRATKRGTRMLRHVTQDVIQLPDIASIQGFLAELQDESKELASRKVEGPLRTLVRLSELAPLIVKAEQKATKDLVPKLCEAYDCPPLLRSRTKTDPVKVENPAITLLACTTPDLGDVQLIDLKRGIGSRCFFIPGSRKPPDRRGAPPDSQAISTIKERLARLPFEYPPAKTEIIPFSKEADALLDKWYNFEATHQPTDELMKFLGVRDIVHVYKVSLIFCALDLQHMIEAFHAQAAIEFVNWLRDVRPLIFAGHGLSPTQQAQQVVERIVKERSEVSYAEALRLFGRNGDAILFKRIVDAEALPGGPIEVRFVGQKRPKRFLVWRG